MVLESESVSEDNERLDNDESGELTGSVASISEDDSQLDKAGGGKEKVKS